MACGERLRVEVAYSAGPGLMDLVSLTLPPGARLAEAVQASGLPARHGLALEGMKVGIWGKLKALDTVLRDRDRVELYRPLRVDPKEARRQRYRRAKPAPAVNDSRN